MLSLREPVFSLFRSPRCGVGPRKFYLNPKNLPKSSSLPRVAYLSSVTVSIPREISRCRGSTGRQERASMESVKKCCEDFWMEGRAKPLFTLVAIEAKTFVFKSIPFS